MSGNHWRVHHLPEGAYPWWAFSPDGARCGAWKTAPELLHSMCYQGFDLESSSFQFAHEPGAVAGEPPDAWWLAMDAEAGDTPGKRCGDCGNWVPGGDTCAQGCEAGRFDAATGWF